MNDLWNLMDALDTWQKIEYLKGYTIKDTATISNTGVVINIHTVVTLIPSDKSQWIRDFIRSEVSAKFATTYPAFVFKVSDG